VGRERLITFMQPVALHVPEDAESYLRLQVIGKTVYAQALMPFGSLRIVAEQLEGEGLQIPIDLLADRSTAAAGAEAQIVGRTELAKTAAPGAAAGGRLPAAAAATLSAEGAGAPAAPDAVALTRYAAKQLYAPMRLASADAAIRQVPLDLSPVLGLYRGARVRAEPIGAWRAGELWVTAVRLSNLEPQPLDIHLEALRGRWITSAVQHGRLGRAGSESDTTALYLVCDQPFEACR